MKHTQQKLLLGAHISIADGLHKSVERAEFIGCTTFQLFTKNNRQWNAPPIQEKEATLFIESVKQSSINHKHVFAHASYLINLGSPKKEVEKKSIKALCDELKRCKQLNIPHLVLHPGSYLDGDKTTCLQQIADNLNLALQQNSETVILLENMAGQGTSTCKSFEEIAYICEKIEDTSRVHVCFDTCHAFAAGYDFRTAKQYTLMWHHFDSIIGLNRLKLIHINDSKKNLGSRVDRHENIGKGYLKKNSFAFLFNDPRFFLIPKILETPKQTAADDLKNMQTIYQLLDTKTKE